MEKEKTNEDGIKWKSDGSYSEDYRQGEISAMLWVVEELQKRIDYYQDRLDID